MLNSVLTSYLQSPVQSILNTIAGTIWTPLNDPGVLWLDGDLDTMVANGSGLVERWNDKFGGSNYVEQNTGSRKPSNTGLLNNLPAMVFNQDYMVMNTEVTGIRTVIIVTDALNGSSNSLVSSLFSGSDNSSTFVTANTTDENYDISVDGNGSFSGTVRWCGNIGVAGTNINLGNTNAGNIGPSIWVISFNQGIKIDEIARLNASLSLIGNIASLRAYTEVLSSEDIYKNEGFEAHRYGLTANLPNDHLYKNERPIV